MGRYDTIKRRPKTYKEILTGAMITDLEEIFSQFAYDFNSHRISTDETLTSFKQDYKSILAAIQVLSSKQTTALAPAQAPDKQQAQPGAEKRTKGRDYRIDPASPRIGNFLSWNTKKCNSKTRLSTH